MVMMYYTLMGSFVRSGRKEPDEKKDKPYNERGESYYSAKSMPGPASYARGFMD